MLNLDSRTRSKLALAATLVAPVLTVQAARLLLGPAASPGSAAAATVETRSGLPPIVAEPPKPLSSAQAKAQTWLMSRTRRLQLRSPMDRPDPKPEEPTPHETRSVRARRSSRGRGGSAHARQSRADRHDRRRRPRRCARVHQPPAISRGRHDRRQLDAHADRRPQPGRPDRRPGGDARSGSCRSRLRSSSLTMPKWQARTYPSNKKRQRPEAKSGPLM